MNRKQAELDASAVLGVRPVFQISMKKDDTMTQDTTKKSAHENDETIQDVLDTFNEKQRLVLYYIVGKAIENEETILDVLNTFNEKQRLVLNYLVGKAIEDAKTGNMFFSTEEKKKIRFMIETEPGEDTTKKEEKEMNFDERAVEIVRNYIMEHLDKSDLMPDFHVYTVWKCKVLQNWKYLISSTLFDGMYYELTYNGDKKEWYLDAYKKFQTVVVKDEGEKSEAN